MLLLCNYNYEGDDYFVNGNFISLSVVSSTIFFIDLINLLISTLMHLNRVTNERLKQKRKKKKKKTIKKWK